MPNVIRSREIPEYIREAYLTQKRRREYPRSYFLLVTPEGERKFPVRDPKTGAYHCGLIRAALTRAGQYKYAQVEEKARNLYQRYCAKKAEFVTKEVKGEMILGAVLVPGAQDTDGDVFTKEAVCEACWDYNCNFGWTLYRHGVPLGKDKVQLIESYVTPAPVKIGDEELPEGTWLQRWKILDEGLRKEIAEGNIVGFSIGGWVELES